MDKDGRVAIQSWVEMNDELDDRVSLAIGRIVRRWAEIEAEILALVLLWYPQERSDRIERLRHAAEADGPPGISHQRIKGLIRLLKNVVPGSESRESSELFRRLMAEISAAQGWRNEVAHTVSWAMPAGDCPAIVTFHSLRWGESVHAQMPMGEGMTRENAPAHREKFKRWAIQNWAKLSGERKVPLAELERRALMLRLYLFELRAFGGSSSSPEKI